MNAPRTRRLMPAGTPCLKGGSLNPKLSALRVLDEKQFSRVILQSLAAHDGNVTATALYLKISRATLNSWLNEFQNIATGLETIRDEVNQNVPASARKRWQ